MQDAVRQLLDVYGFVAAIHQLDGSQLGPVVFAGFVETPVFGYSQRLVVEPLRPVSSSAVLADATSNTKSGGLPCSPMM